MDRRSISPEKSARNDVQQLLNALRAVGEPSRIRLLAACAHSGPELVRVDLKGAAIVVGSEAHGVSERILAHSERVVIPTEGVESLNAAAAAAVLLYEAARRRGASR